MNNIDTTIDYDVITEEQPRNKNREDMACAICGKTVKSTDECLGFLNGQSLVVACLKHESSEEYDILRKKCAVNMKEWVKTLTVSFNK